MNVSEDFSNRLQNLMTERGISMADLARLLHTQQSTITRWNRGSKPQRNTMMQLAQVLRVELEWLARGTGPRHSYTSGTVRQGETLSEKNLEQEDEKGRLEEMGYGSDNQGDNSGTVLGEVLSAASLPELLKMVERLQGRRAAVKAVIAEVSRRTRSLPTGSNAGGHEDG